jgi:hypothetical protein
MKRLIPVLVLITLFSSCKKSKSAGDFIWEKSYGTGSALFISTLPDSGLIACGQSDGKPYLVRLNKTMDKVLDFSSDEQGLFSSAWCDTSGYVIGGNASGKMSLSRYDTGGNKLWEKSPDAGFYIDFTNIFYTGSGQLLAIGTASPDSVNSGATGLLFIRFDTTGQIIAQNNLTEPDFISATKSAIDNDGNIYLALTRKSGSSESTAGVAKYNDQLQKLWETDLYNNPDFGAASRAIILDASGNIYVTGNTELSTADGKLNNSFVVSLTNSGSIRDGWKKYLENSNEGSALLFDNAGGLMMLNRNCYIVNILSPDDGSDIGKIRMFSVCHSDDTDALGEDFSLDYENNILVAGSLGGSFFMALKSSQ